MGNSKSEEEKTFEALLELVKEGHLSWATAVSELRAETGESVTYISAMGYVAAFRRAYNEYQLQQLRKQKDA